MSCTARPRSTLRTKAPRSRLASWSLSPEATRPRHSYDSLAAHPTSLPEPFADADDLFSLRRAEADEFYGSITPPGVDEDAKSVMRQALAGMLWSKQTYYFDLDVWLRERQSHPLRSPSRRGTRNESWFHMVNQDVISMPDKWEYPWYAAWDLAFHCIPLAMVDPDFAKSQLRVMLSQLYLHPSGQMPAYEWNFGDVNPPVHAFATLFLHSVELETDTVDIEFLKEAFTRLMLNFQWWVNRKDPEGRNLFEGGFLGLDNIGVFDRSAKLPTGGSLEQADGTAWMAMFSQNMLELAIAVAEHDPAYEDLVLKFIEHFFWIAAAVDPDGRPPRRDVGRGGRVLLRRAAAPGRHGSAAQGALTRRPAPDLRGHGHRTRPHRALPPPRGAHPRRISSATTTCSRPSPIPSCPAPTAGASSPSSTRTSSGGSSRVSSTKSASSVPTASARSRDGISSTRTGSMSRARSTKCSTNPRSRRPGCSVATRTGAGPCGCRSTCSSFAPCCSTTGTTATRSRSSARLAPA